MNRVILMGRLTHDPEMRMTPQSINVATFDIAVNRQFVKEGQQQADFIHCVAWRQTGEFINRYFTKGKMIAIEGKLQSRIWQGNDGKARVSYEVVVDQAHFCGKEETRENHRPPEGYSVTAITDRGAILQPENGFTDLTGDESSEDTLQF